MATGRSAQRFRWLRSRRQQHIPSISFCVHARRGSGRPLCSVVRSGISLPPRPGTRVQLQSDSGMLKLSMAVTGPVDHDSCGLGTVV
jgi:hypothetical protein